MNTTCKLTMAIAVLLLASCKCTKSREDPSDYSRIDLLTPECVQVEGGSVHIYGRNLDKIHGVTLVKGSSRESIGNIEVIPTPDSEPNTEATLTLPAIDPEDDGLYTLEFSWYYRILYIQERCDSRLESRMLTQPLEYMDSPDPIILDGDETCMNSVIPAGEAPKPNPEVCSGHYCGGYERTIWGLDLFPDIPEKPTIIWNGTQLSSLAITDFGTADDGRDFIKLTVPEGPEGVWVDFTVIAPPMDCPPESNVGEFFYEQGACEEEGPPVVDEFDHYEAGSGNKLVAIGEVVDHDSDSVPDNNDVVVVEASVASAIRTYKGDGLGNLELHSVSALPGTMGTPTAFELGHFDGDEFADAAIALVGPNELLLVFNEGLGMHTSSSSILTLPLPAEPSDVAVGDFDDDGDDDLAVVCVNLVGSPETIVVFFRNDGPKLMTSEPWTRLSATVDFASLPLLAAGDLDGSGGTDLVVSAGPLDISTYVSSSPGATEPLTLGDSLLGSSSHFVTGLDTYARQILLLSFDPLAGTGVVTLFPLSAADPTASTEYPLDLASPVALDVGNLNSDTSKPGYVVGHAAGQVEIFKEIGVSTLKEIADFSMFDLAVGVLDETSPADIVLAGNSGSDEIVVIKNDF